MDSVGFYCNGMLYFAAIFFRTRAFFDGFRCSPEFLLVENALTDYLIFQVGKLE